MIDANQGTALIIYPESDGQPMTESDPTRDYLLYCVEVLESLPLELRFYDPQTGAKLLSYRELEQAREQAEAERIQAEQAREQAEAERIQAEQARREAISRLFALGLSPEQIAEALNLPMDEVVLELRE